MEPSDYSDLVAGVVRGRKLIVCADVLVVAAAQAKEFTKLGASNPLLVAGTEGTGELPGADEADVVLLNTHGDTLMDGIRAFERAIADPSPELVAKVDAYDPDHSALFIGTLFSTDGVDLGRRAYGSRPAAWERLEDKTVIDEVLVRAGVRCSPHEVVAASRDELAAAHAALDLGTGTAMAGDAREGWWGGASYFRWVGDERELDDAAAFFAEHCDKVRVLPFLEGIPCSIHGMVFDDEVIAFRPVEMITLRHADRRELRYTGVATFWDPSDDDRDDMRNAACRAGKTLRDEVSYRGLFTLDGVITADGFRPTELNPRGGAGLSPQIGGLGLPLHFLSRMTIECEPVDLKPTELERLVIEHADAHRSGRCFTTTAMPAEQVQYPVVSDPEGFRPADEGETPDGHMVRGPSPLGSFNAYVPDPSRMKVGPSFAPIAARAFAYMDEHFDTGLGPLEAAKNVR